MADDPPPPAHGRDPDPRPRGGEVAPRPGARRRGAARPRHAAAGADDRGRPGGRPGRFGGRREPGPGHARARRGVRRPGPPPARPRPQLRGRGSPRPGGRGGRAGAPRPAGGPAASSTERRSTPLIAAADVDDDADRGARPGPPRTGHERAATCARRTSSPARSAATAATPTPSGPRPPAARYLERDGPLGIDVDTPDDLLLVDEMTHARDEAG